MPAVTAGSPRHNVFMYFVVDPDRDVSPQHAALLWRRLWEMRDFVPIAALLPAVVSSPCPLLPDERVNGVLAASLTLVPTGSAWASIDVDLAKYTRPDGELRTSVFESALRGSVERAERSHDGSYWSHSAEASDSRLNRRLSIFVRGWGDLVARRGQDPANHAVLGCLRELAANVSRVLVAASRAMAEERGYCPAIDVAGARVLQHGEEMNARWRRAIAENAIRHRNLLTLSPWDVFPRDCPADPRFANLLPILSHADSVSLRRDADISHWNVNEFRQFHERVAAILRCSSEQDLIAKRV
jgi:hypothetical protein